MSFTCVISSIALAQDADRPTGASSSNPSYASRAWMLRNVIVPWYASTKCFDEIVVAGEFEPGPLHAYVNVPSVHHNVLDLLAQRQAGVDATHGGSGDWVFFQSDDHLWDPTNQRPNGGVVLFPVLAPSRWSRGRSSIAEPVNDGDHGAYLTGHGLLMQRWVSAAAPWTACPANRPVDLAYTAYLKQRNVLWAYAPEYRIWDLEYGAMPWL